MNRLAQHLRREAGWPWATARFFRMSPPHSANILRRYFRRRGERAWLGANGPRQNRLSHDPEPLEVLVVDDSALVRQRLKSIIESDGQFRVVLAADPYEAVAMLSKSVPGVIVLDVEMPRMDGLTFLRKLMRQHPMPVVLCTSQAERAVTALEMGAIEVIAKPDWNNANRLADWSQNLLESIRNAARRPAAVSRRSTREHDRSTAHSRRGLAQDCLFTPRGHQ